MQIILNNGIVRATLNTYGGAIDSLVHLPTGREHYWPYDPARWPRRTSVCFPVCGGLIDGAYRYGGQTYAMPMHGYLRETEMTVIEQSDTRLVLEAVSDAGTRQRYPFDYRFRLIQQLEGSSLCVEYEVCNTGSTEMLFSTGAHYTYALPALQSACRYWFSAPQQAGSYTQDNGIILTKSGDVFHGRNYLPMDHLFDTASTILENSDVHSDFIAIGTADGPFTAVESRGFLFTILWAPKGNDSPFACIEPWAGMADFAGHDQELTHKRGIQRLAAGESRTYWQRITLL